MGSVVENTPLRVVEEWFLEAKAIRVLLRLVEGALARLLFFCVGLRGYVVIGVVGVSEQMSSLSHAFFFAPCKICRVALITMRSWCVLPLSLFDGVGVGRLVDWDRHYP